MDDRDGRPTLFGDARWMVEDVTDGDTVHLPSKAFVGRVDADGPPITARSGVNIDAMNSADLSHVL